MSSSLFIIGDLVVSSAELLEVNQKVRELGANVGVELNDRERLILAQLSSPGIVKKPVSDLFQENVDAIGKFCSEGHCYTSLFALLPSVSSVSTSRVETMMETLIDDLGKNPDGPMVITALTQAELALKTSGDFRKLYNSLSTLLEIGKSTQVLDSIMKVNNVRFEYGEDGGLIHLTLKSVHCEHDDVLCDHGWSPRFVLQILARQGTKVGGTRHHDIDFSALFMDQQTRVEKAEDEGSFVSALSVEQPVPQTNPLRQSYRAPELETIEESVLRIVEERKREKIQQDLHSEMASVLSDQLEKRTQMLEQALADLCRQNAEPTPVDCDLASTIMPNDSSTTIERYTSNRRFMPAYTVGNTETLDTNVDLLAKEPEQKQVVTGFNRTEQMVSEERKSYDRVYLINGLAAPFKNGRLNFLTHLHTALSECSFDPQSDPLDAVEELAVSKPRNPTGELVRQVVNRTFDFERLVVIANPFRMPFIEVGMNLTDSVIQKTLDLLHSEYKTTWFQEVKCLRVPSFHGDYTKFSTDVTGSERSRSRRSGRRRGSAESRQDDHEQRTSGSTRMRSVVRPKGQNSVLGIRF